MRTTVLAVLIAVAVATTPRAQSRNEGGREEFTATASSVGGPLTAPVLGQLDLVIIRWSTDGERQRFMEAMLNGQRTAVETLQNLPRVGFIRAGPAVGWDLRFAQQVRDEDGGRRIFLATDRVLSFAEQVLQPRSSQYPFTFIELRVNADGRGEGRLSPAARAVNIGGRWIELENYDTQPIALTGVRRR